MEQRLKVIEVTKGDKVYHNLDLRGLEVDNYIIVEKVYAEGMPFPSRYKDSKGNATNTYSIGIKYNDEVCSTWLSQSQHNEYKDVGGVGDKVKISKYTATVTVKAGELIVKRLKFEKA